jgi:type VI secretion system VasD/TssJ family lipoprotein
MSEIHLAAPAGGARLWRASSSVEEKMSVERGLSSHNMGGAGWCSRTVLFLLVPVIVMLPACATTRIPCQGYHLDLTLNASQRLNPDAQGRSLYTVVQVFQLKSLQGVEAAGSPAELNAKLLEGDLAGEPYELTLGPGEQLNRKLARAPEARYIIAQGMFFRSSESERSWSVHRLGESCADEQIQFELEGYRIEVPANRRKP